MGFRKGRKASLASASKNACEDSCSRSKKVLGKFPFSLLVLAQSSISLVSELVIGSASSYRLSWAQITVRKQRKMLISEFPYFVASINAIQSLRLSAVKMAVSERELTQAVAVRGTRGELEVPLE
ncbi:hypothetical protein M9H77_06470 [Catharanthus roseus]|uniref:Uncharacterized protein n=1 Tax=Catharanthus roseus TaxID=4058 RepID=A0ACC0BS65_CATRO|nr:hypothetical protein M9H77_06470 [Catharanthus roseus]